MISWGTIAYGAALSAVLAALLTGLTIRQHRAAATIGASAGALTGPIAWNAILHATHASTFFTDAPIAVFPASWQDTGSAVFTFAATTLILGLITLRKDAAARVVSIALIAAASAFLIDIYLY
jgi:hypothetical protein